MKRYIFIIAQFLFFSIIVGKAQTVDFSYSTNTGVFCAPQIVTFSQKCTGSPLKFIWNFGNGQSSINPNASTKYAGSGNYTITLLAIYDTTTISISKTIVISPTPTITLMADKNNLCKPGIINFTANSSNEITKYEWNFNDNSPSEITKKNTIAHNFINFGTNTVNLKVTTDKGCTDSTTNKISITKFPVTGSVTLSNGCIPSNTELTINPNFPTGDALDNINWQFGDGSSNINTTTKKTSHIYNTTSEISTAKAYITSLNGCTNEYNFSTIAYGTPPYATTLLIQNNKDSFCTSETISFVATAMDANSYNWDFGNGVKTSSKLGTTTQKYRNLGFKTVTVIPVFNGCKGEERSTVIFIKAPIATYTFGNTCDAKNIYSFNNTSLGAMTKNYWTFSDDLTFIDSVNSSPSHTFPLFGSFTSQLIAANNITGCSDTLIKNIYTATPTFISNTTKVCKDSALKFNVTNTYNALSGNLYEFHGAGSIVNNNTDSSLLISPKKFGDFANYIVIKDANPLTCNDTLHLSDSIHVRGPIVDFTAPSKLCIDTATILKNTSYPYSTNDNIVSWLWNFGNGNKDTLRNPDPYFYKNASGYSISLTATDINNCKQTKLQPIIINSLPLIQIFPKKYTICLNEVTQLKAFTLDTLAWLSNPYISCTSCDTIMIKPSSNSNFIATAKNSDGCKKSDTSFIKVNLPETFKISPVDTTICLGRTIQYNSIGSANTTWSPANYLNNNTIGVPLAKPEKAIQYMVINKDAVGCFTDTAFVKINLFQAPTIDAGQNKILPYNSNFIITPNYSDDIIKYNWLPSNDLNCTDCSNPTGIAKTNTTYQIKGTNANGCSITDSITISILCQYSNLLIPTAFTPNGNGLNEYFYPITRGYKRIKSFSIFNRYGQKVFERKDFAPNIPALGWNGSYLKETTNEVFVWLIEAECLTGEIINSRGTVLITK